MYSTNTYPERDYLSGFYINENLKYLDMNYIWVFPGRYCIRLNPVILYSHVYQTCSQFKVHNFTDTWETYYVDKTRNAYRYNCCHTRILKYAWKNNFLTLFTASYENLFLQILYSWLKFYFFIVWTWCFVVLFCYHSISVLYALSYFGIT